jgi:hypothetical protein
VVFKYDSSIEVSLFNGGRMLIKNAKDQKAALEVNNSIVKTLREKS